MEQVVFEYDHSTEGRISLIRDGQTVAFSCRWPLDLSTSEYITLSDSFELAEYTREVELLQTEGVASLRGENGTVTITATAQPNIVLIEIAHMGAIPQSLRLPIPAAASQFMPDRTC